MINTISLFPSKLLLSICGGAQLLCIDVRFQDTEHHTKMISLDMIINDKDTRMVTR